MQIVGSLAAAGDWEEEDSIDDDTATDGGEVSHLGSESSAASSRVGAAAGVDSSCGMVHGEARFSGGSGLDDGFDDGGIGPPDSEDSGF